MFHITQHHSWRWIDSALSSSALSWDVDFKEHTWHRPFAARQPSGRWSSSCCQSQCVSSCFSCLTAAAVSHSEPTRCSFWALWAPSAVVRAQLGFKLLLVKSEWETVNSDTTRCFCQLQEVWMFFKMHSKRVSAKNHNSHFTDTGRTSVSGL